MKPEVSWFLLLVWIGSYARQSVGERLRWLVSPPRSGERSYDRWALSVLILLLLTAIFAPPTMAQETVRLECTPRTFRVVPGEPIRLELAVRADRAASIRLHVPGNPSLKLRAVEKLPVRRTAAGVIVHSRVIVWQALEPGVIKINKLSVETQGRKLAFPEVTITVRDPGP